MYERPPNVNINISAGIFWPIGVLADIFVSNLQRGQEVELKYHKMLVGCCYTIDFCHTGQTAMP